MSDLSLIEIGRLGKCRGFQGDIHLYLNDQIELSTEPKHLFIEVNGLPVPHKVVRVGEHNGVMTVAFDRLESKEDVEVHKNTTVYIEDQYVIIEESAALVFVDYEVYDQDANHIGQVVDVIDQSPLLLLQVKAHNKDKVYTLPYHDDLLINEDVDSKRLTIEIVEGLLNI